MVDQLLLQGLYCGSEESYASTCRTLLRPEISPSQAYLKPLFHRMSGKILELQDPALTLEVINRIGRAGHFAYNGAKNSVMERNLFSVYSFLRTSARAKTKDVGPEWSRSAFFARCVLRTFARRYSFATGYLIDALDDSSFALELVASTRARLAASSFSITPEDWNRLVRRYRNAVTASIEQPDTTVLVNRNATGWLLAQVAYSNPKLAQKSSGVMEELLLERHQATAETALAAVIVRGTRNLDLLPVLEETRRNLQGIEGVNAYVQLAIEVASGKRRPRKKRSA